ncbi:MAG: N-acetyl-gamma-glutamyl-phosphate reductase [Ruminococcus sp.]
MAVKVFIDGQAGTTGLRIHERLADRKDLTMITLTEETRKDPEARRAAILESDVTFLCLPDDAAREAVALAGDADVRIIDASTAHRTNPDWAYGFPELSPEHREKIRTSKRVAVPGCYASGFASLVYPMVHSGLLPKLSGAVLAMSGYSGGGKKMIAEIESPDRAPELYRPRFYGLANNHKHLPEMQKISGLEKKPMFTPIVDDYYNGMVVCVPIQAAVSGFSLEPERVQEMLNATMRAQLRPCTAAENAGRDDSHQAELQRPA